MGRRQGVSITEQEFRQRFASALSEAIGNERGAQTRAAKKLGVKRQTISLYLKGKTTPGGEVLRRALEDLGLPLQYGALPVDSKSFPRRAQPRITPRQLKLFSEDRRVTVEAVRKSADSFDVKVSVNFARGR